MSNKISGNIKENTIEAFLQKETKINKNMSYYYFHNNFGFSKEIFYGVFDYYTVAYVSLQIIYKQITNIYILQDLIW